MHDRYRTAVARCAMGLSAKSEPAHFNLDQVRRLSITKLVVGAERCVRAIVALDQPGHAAQVDLVDGQGHALASASADGTIVVPVDGPVCVPRDLELEVRVSAETAPSSGLVGLLESR